MARQTRQTRRTRTKSRSRGLRGGDLAGNPPSSWGWTMGTLGNGWTQFMNSLSIQPGQNTGTMGSNASVPVGNLNAQDSRPFVKMTGGKHSRNHSHKRSHSRSRGKKGGSISSVFSRAIVPGVLLAAQQMYGKTKKRR